jgi:hypothetical protein
VTANSNRASGRAGRAPHRAAARLDHTATIPDAVCDYRHGSPEWFAWHNGFRAGAEAVNAIWERTFPTDAELAARGKQ